MDLIDLWWNLSQQGSIKELQRRIYDADARGSQTLSRQAKLIGLLEKENEELRLRVGVLIRVLIEKNVIAAEEFSSAVAVAKTNLKAARTKAEAFKKLPKPPKGKLKKPTPHHLKRTSPKGQGS